MPEAQPLKQAMPSEADILCSIFGACFAESMRTRLLGGGEEPLYQPAKSSDDYHQIIFRSDYAASALHEVSHWCIAGERRRQQLDYGYWYEPDGRSVAQQRVFESVEARPQALEWLFRVSIDNLNGDAVDPFPFQLAVWQAVHRYLANGLPTRAAVFWRALQKYYALPQSADPRSYTLESIIAI